MIFPKKKPWDDESEKVESFFFPAGLVIRWKESHYQLYLDTPSAGVFLFKSEIQAFICQLPLFFQKHGQNVMYYTSTKHLSPKPIPITRNGRTSGTKWAHTSYE